jgi:hypothetical protein
MAAVFLVGAVQLFTADSAIAQQIFPCEIVIVSDLVTGGGFILVDTNNDGISSNANFGVAGACRNLSGWGHLNYLDHDSSPHFHVHWESITGYFREGDDSVDSNGHPIGTRDVCGTATTNDDAHPTVNFRVQVRDAGEPGVNDTFRIQLADFPLPITEPCVFCFYDTGTQFLGGGNIQLHKGIQPPEFFISCDIAPV